MCAGSGLPVRVPPHSSSLHHEELRAAAAGARAEPAGGVQGVRALRAGAGVV